MEEAAQNKRNSGSIQETEGSKDQDQGKDNHNNQSQDSSCDDQKNDDNQKEDENQDKNGHNTVEKITFYLGIVVLVILFGFLIYQWNNETSKPPKLVITTSYQPQMGHYGFKIDVENVGDETAEAANIEFSLYQEGERKESGTVEFQYIAVKSKETAWIVFHSQRKPQDSLVVSSITYTKP